MKKTTVISLALLFTLLLYGCSKKSDTTQIKENTANQTNKQKEPLGDRTNPAGLKETIAYSLSFKDDAGTKQTDSFQIEVTDFIRGKEAQNYLLDANSHNSAAPKGMEWALFDVTLTLKKGTPDKSYFYMPTFSILDASGYVMEQKSEAILKTEDAFGFLSLKPEQTIQGKVAKLVLVDKPISLEYVDGNKKIFFKFD